MQFVKLPMYKAYLYTLLQRFRLFRGLNTASIKLGFTRDQAIRVKQVMHTYLSKEVIQKSKAYIYDALLQSVLINNVRVATKEEIELINKLLWIKKLNLKELVMEIKEIKNFGKEVGLKAMEMLKMDEETLIKEIIQRVNQQATYSDEFVAWYDDLPPEIFDSAESIREGDEGNINQELIDAINETTKIVELKNFCKEEDYQEFFGSIDVNKFKTINTLKGAMLEALEKVVGGDNGSSELDIDDDTKAEIIDTVNSITNEDELTEFLSDPDMEEMFIEHLNLDDFNIDNIKSQILTLLGFVEEEKAEEKPMTLKERLAAKKASTSGKAEKKEEKSAYVIKDFDPNEFDLEAIVEEVMNLPITSLKTFAKQLEITQKVGVKKDDLQEMVITKLSEMAGEDTKGAKGETEITPELVNDAIEGKDLETLISICESMELKLNPLQKKSAKAMGNIILENLPETETSKKSPLKKEDKKAPKEERQSIYQLIEDMVLAKNDESEIAKAVTDYYKGLGKSIIYIKKVIKQLITIIKGDYDME